MVDRVRRVSSDTFLSKGGSAFERVEFPGYIRRGRYATAGLLRGRFALVNHLSKSAILYGPPHEIVRLREPVSFDPAFDDRYTNYALFDNEVWALGSDGAIHHAKLGDFLVPITKPNDDLVRYSRRACLGWDAEHERLVLFDSEKNGRTYVLARGARAFEELVSKPKPPRGSAGMCSTRAGLFLLTAKDLFRLDNEGWKRVPHEPHVVGRTLFADEASGEPVLYVAQEKGIFRLERDRFVHVEDLPPDARAPGHPGHTMNNTDTFGFDPHTRSVIAVTDDRIWSAP